jgi:hypothetical protein
MKGDLRGGIIQSPLNFIASSLMSAERSKLYVDLPGFITPSFITGDQLRPDLLLAIENKVLHSQKYATYASSVAHE